jgi:NAD(P)-dependent dehydrogenase (short-subunit alcohol dehydrogenase family)
MKDLEGRVAVVTGAGSGIGRGTALALAESGMHVVVADIDEASAKAVAGAEDDRSPSRPTSPTATPSARWRTPPTTSSAPSTSCTTTRASR